jgi:hypothetical protein
MTYWPNSSNWSAESSVRGNDKVNRPPSGRFCRFVSGSSTSVSESTSVECVLSFIILDLVASQVGDFLNDFLPLLGRHRLEGPRQADFFLKLIEGLGAGDQR